MKLAHPTCRSVGALALVLSAGLAGTAIAAPPAPPAPAGSPTALSGVQTVIGDRPPAAPGRPTVVPLPEGGFRVAWADGSKDEHGFEIERFPGFEEGVREVGANVQQYDDLQPLSQARYRVRALGDRLNSRWTAWTVAHAAATGFQTLAPGVGFQGPTAQPAPVGTEEMDGYDAKAIARWNVVPNQTFSGTFAVGVLAFHRNGIDRVEFSVNGGEWKAVREARLNPATNTREFMAVIRARDFHDGKLEVRAIAYPKSAGVPRVLAGEYTYDASRTGEHSITLFANANRTLPTPTRYVSPTGNDDWPGTREEPMRTMTRAAASIVSSNNGVGDGGTVYLLPGVYAKEKLLIPTTERWFTISGAPDVPRSQVILNDADVGSPRSQFMRIANLSGRDATPSAFFSGSGCQGRMLWLDNLDLAGTDRHMGGAWCSSFNSVVQFATRVDLSKRIEGLKKFALIRDCSISTIQADALGDDPLVINTTIRDVFADGSGAHSDVYQWSPSEGVDNFIISRLVAEQDISAQGLFAGGGVTAPPLMNIAICDTRINNQPAWHLSSRGVFQYARRISHMVIDNSHFLGPARWRSSITDNVMIQSTTWSNPLAAVDPITQPGVWYEE